MPPRDERILKTLKSLEEEGLYRELPHPIPEGCLDLRSNDHLGFASAPSFSNALKEALKESPLQGSTGSRLISGNSEFIEALEKELASFYREETALLFPSGYQANVGLLSAIGDKGMRFLYDERVHASMRDGIRLSFARARSFRHNDPDELERLLKREEGASFVLTEGLFSMDGDRPPLKEFLAICRAHDAFLILDEAHSNGVWGPHGEGIAVEEGVDKELFARIMPFGKAFAQQGAAVLGSEKLRDFLINRSRPFIFSTAPSFPFLLALQTALHRVKEADEERGLLFQKVRSFREKASAKGLPLLPEAHGPVQGVLVKGEREVMELEKDLWEEGFAVKGIRSPSVPKGSERVRIMIHASTPEEGLEKLIDSMATRL